MLIPIIIIVLSGITHFAYFGFPKEVLFDEVHFGYYISQYWQGSYYFDIHPPLAKLILSFVGYFADIPRVVNWSTIGNELPDQWVLMRLIPLLAGIFLPLIVYAICKRLNLSNFASFAAALLIIVENSLLVQSRAIIFDVMILFFGFLALLFYLEYRNKITARSFLIASALCASAALSIKWTGVSFVALIILVEIFFPSRFLHRKKESLKRLFKFIGVFAVTGVIFYFTIFTIHLSLLTNTGSGNDFMSPEFQKSLSGNKFANDPNIQPLGLTAKFLELNYQIYEYSSNLNTPHDYASEWYTWPLMKRPIFYWQSTDINRYIYYLGNPLIYWLGGASIIVLTFYGVRHYIRSRHRVISPDSLPILFILAGFAGNFLPFAFIGRTMFLYHYETALVFGILGIAFLIDKIGNDYAKKLIGITVIVSCAATFLYFSPLTYGRVLSDMELNSRMWFPTWR